MQKEDKVLSIGTQTIRTPQDLIDAVKSQKGEIAITVERAGKPLTLRMTPVDARIGVSVYGDIQIQKDFVYRYGFFEAARISAIEVYSQSRLTLELL